jgi:hypothetical protein
MTAFVFAQLAGPTARAFFTTVVPAYTSREAIDTLSSPRKRGPIERQTPLAGRRSAACGSRVWPPYPCRRLAQPRRSRCPTAGPMKSIQRR